MDILTIMGLGILGGLFGWVYGGNLLGYIGTWFGKEWEDRVNAVDKILYFIAYGILFGLLMPAVALYSMAALGLSQYARRAVSWGPYIGCLIHGKLELVKDTSKLRWLKPDYWIDLFVFEDGAKTDNLKLRSCAALSLIGAWGGVILSLGVAIAYAVTGLLAPAGVLLIPVAMLLKGPIYWACIELSGKFTPLQPGDTRPIETQIEDQRNDGWGYSEIAYNAYMWLVVACTMVGVS